MQLTSSTQKNEKEEGHQLEDVSINEIFQIHNHNHGYTTLTNKGGHKVNNQR